MDQIFYYIGSKKKRNKLNIIFKQRLVVTLGLWYNLKEQIIVCLFRRVVGIFLNAQHFPHLMRWHQLQMIFFTLCIIHFQEIPVPIFIQRVNTFGNLVMVALVSTKVKLISITKFKDCFSLQCMLNKIHWSRTNIS